MTDTLTRRDTLLRTIAGAALGHGAPALASGVAVDEQAVAIGRFIAAGSASIPARARVVQTSGYYEPGRGGATYIADTAVDAAYLRAYSRTAFAAADGRGFRLASKAVDVAQTGAVGDGKIDDTDACQAALDHAERDGGGPVTLPPGDYRITAPLRLPGRVELIGGGQASVIHANSCDGLRIEPSNAIGPRRIANFWLRGAVGERFAAIVSDIAAPARAQGLVFENLYITFFGTGIVSRGLWHTTFRSVTMNNVAAGLRFVDRNVKILVEDARLTRGELLKAEGRSVGIQVGDATARFRPEDVQVHRSLIYGFGTAIVWRTALFGVVSGCDMDACGESGLELVTADGGFTLRDSWIQVIGGDAKAFGVNATPLGYRPHDPRVTIADNRIGTDAAGRGVGIFVGHGQSGVTLSGNSVTAGWLEGLRIDGTTATHCRGNRINAPVWIGNTTRTVWAENVVNGTVVLPNNTAFAASAPTQ